MEPISMSVLSGAFLMEGIKFLWKQASNITDSYIQKKKEVEQPNPPQFLKAPPTDTIDLERAKEKAADLVIFRDHFKPYAEGEKPIPTNDEIFKIKIDTLQKLIEYIYGEKFQVKEDHKGIIQEAIGESEISVKKSKMTAKEGTISQKAENKSKIIIDDSELKVG